MEKPIYDGNETPIPWTNEPTIRKNVSYKDAAQCRSWAKTWRRDGKYFDGWRTGYPV